MFGALGGAWGTISFFGVDSRINFAILPVNFGVDFGKFFMTVNSQHRTLATRALACVYHL